MNVTSSIRTTSIRTTSFRSTVAAGLLGLGLLAGCGEVSGTDSAGVSNRPATPAIRNTVSADAAARRSHVAMAPISVEAIERRAADVGDDIAGSSGSPASADAAERWASTATTVQP